MTPPSTSRRVLKSGLSLLVARYGQPLLTFAIFFLAARFLPLADLGAYVLLVNMLFIFQATAVLGLVPLLTREISGEQEAASRWFGAMMALALPASLVAWLAMPLVSLGLNYSPLVVTGSIVMGASLPFSVVIQSAEGVFLAHGRSRALWMPSLVECSFRLALSAYLLVSGHGLVALLLAFTGSRLVGLTVAAIFLRDHLGRGKPVLDLKRVRALAHGIPTFGLMFVAAIMFLRVDAIIITSLAGEEAAGLYGAAYRLVLLTFLLPESLVAVMFPVLTRKLAQDRKESASLVRLTLRFLLVIETPLVLGVAAASGWFLPIMFGPHFAASGRLGVVLSFVLLPHSINGLLGFLLQADHREKTALWLVLGGLVAHVLVIWGFVFWGGLDGAVWGLLLSTAAMAGIHVFVVSRSLFPLDAARTLTGVVLGCLAGGGLLALAPENWVLSRFLLAPALGLICLFGLGVLTPAWLKQTWTSFREARG